MLFHFCSVMHLHFVSHISSGRRKGKWLFKKKTKNRKKKTRRYKVNVEQRFHFWPSELGK